MVCMDFEASVWAYGQIVFQMNEDIIVTHEIELITYTGVIPPQHTPEEEQLECCCKA